MISKVLHYYKGDFLDELSELVDFTVLLNLSSRQKKEVEKLKIKRAMKIKSSVGSAAYLHPNLYNISGNSNMNDEKIIFFLENVRDGMKAKFFITEASVGALHLLGFLQYTCIFHFIHGNDEIS